MNKYETAIAEIQDHTEHNLKTKLSADTCEIVVEACEKQVPKKVIRGGLFSTMAVCPCCDFDLFPTVFLKHNIKRCNECGQALDWRCTDE